MISTPLAMQGNSICVVGNINRDLKTSPLKAGDHLFHDGETSAGSILETIGGGGANSAFAAARLGARVTFLGKVGADALGDRLRRTLEKHHILASLVRSPSHASGTSLALTFDTGQRHFISCLPANESLTYSDLNLSALVGCDHLLRADIWFSREMLFEGNLTLFQHARELGMAVSVDLNWDPQWGHADASTIGERKRAVRAALPWVDLAHGNERELKEFTDSADLATALKKLSDWGVGATVVHLGSQGAGYYFGNELTVAPPAPVRNFIHAAGTGDVLSICMMLLHHPRNELQIQQKLRLSNQIVAEFIEGNLRLIPELAD